MLVKDGGRGFGADAFGGGGGGFGLSGGMGVISEDQSYKERGPPAAGDFGAGPCARAPPTARVPLTVRTPSVSARGPSVSCPAPSPQSAATPPSRGGSQPRGGSFVVTQPKRESSARRLRNPLGVLGEASGSAATPPTPTRPKPRDSVAAQLASAGKREGGRGGGATAASARPSLVASPSSPPKRPTKARDSVAAQLSTAGKRPSALPQAGSRLDKKAASVCGQSKEKDDAKRWAAGSGGVPPPRGSLQPGAGGKARVEDAFGRAFAAGEAQSRAAAGAPVMAGKGGSKRPSMMSSNV